MSAPQYVPKSARPGQRVYESPPWQHDPWTGHPAANLTKGQPRGRFYGNQGPDQGYVLVLAEGIEPVLQAGEDLADVRAGVVGVALKRGSLFGRAPVIHDLTLAYTIFGFLDESPDPALVDLRRELFASAAHHYAERRAIVDLVPEATLRLTPTQAAEAYAGGWRGPLGLND
ncbi:MAG: hypothetical protein H6518_14670 [Microthrixaceae bacterium]|nr:hypothetical protein [Microthrixaceae bacterium]